MALSEKYCEKGTELSSKEPPSSYGEYIENFDMRGLGDFIWEQVGKLDVYIAENEPYKVVKEDEERGKEMINHAREKLADIAVMIEPLLPGTYEKMKEAIEVNIKPKTPLFERKEIMK
jgi:methionyl-tRNA synthetase